MKAWIHRSTDWTDKLSRLEEINSLEDLLKLHEKTNAPLIIKYYKPNSEKEQEQQADIDIEIYDGDRE